MQVKIVGTPFASPHPATVEAPPSARDRAIAKLVATPEAPPVAAPASIPNPSMVSPEDIHGQLTGKNDSNEEAVEAAEQTPAEATEQAPEDGAKKEDKLMSSKYAALARREKALRAQAFKQEQALKAREAALAAKEAELASKAPTQADYSNYISKDQLKQNALQALADANVSYEELTQQILNQGSIDPRAQAALTALEAKIAKLEAAAEEAKKQSETAQQEQYKSALRQIETDVKRLVATDSSFEMIKATRSEKDVVELIESHFKEHGELLTNEEAAQQVEDYLVEEAERLAKIDKIKKRLMPAASTQAKTTPVQQPSEKPKQTQPQMKTLTNSNSTSRQLSARERAVLAFRGELK